MMDVPTTRISCCDCGFVFWISTSFHCAREEDHGSFYCPRCRTSLYYPQKTDVEICKDEAARLKRNLEISRRNAQRLLDENTALERRRISQKGATTKLRKQLDTMRKVA